MTKPTKWHVFPAKIRSAVLPPSLIRVFAVRLKKPWVYSFPLSAQRRHWSVWALMSFYWFCHAAAHIWKQISFVCQWNSWIITDIQQNDPTTLTRVVVAALTGVVSVTTTDTKVLFVEVVVTVLLFVVVVVFDDDTGGVSGGVVVVGTVLLVALSLMHHHSVHERLRAKKFAWNEPWYGKKILALCHVWSSKRVNVATQWDLKYRAYSSLSEAFSSSVYCVYEQRRLWRDCRDAQDRLSPRCLAVL